MEMPKIKVEYSDFITIRDIKAVKQYAKEQRNELTEQLQSICALVHTIDNELYVGIEDVLRATATYYNSYEKPVFHIYATGYDTNTERNNDGIKRGGHKNSFCFVEIFCSLTEYEEKHHNPIINIYH